MSPAVPFELDGHGERIVVPTFALVPPAATRPALEHLRGDQFEEYIYPGSRHEVLSEVNRDEVLDDVAGFLARVLATAG